LKSRLFWLSALVILTIGATHVPEAQATPEENLYKLFGKLDVNRDKRLSEQEFVGEKGRAARAKARKQFRMLDENGDGSLSAHEFKRATRHD
jgi:hypothetical protein